ncbi:MAG: SPOR domain-containing protein, partial [Thermacetogeniaceae bacterium]
PPLPAQQKALEALLRELMRRFGIPPASVLGHREVSGAATDCPGSRLDMGELRRALSHQPGEAAPEAHEKIYRVQAGAFSERENAEALAERLQAAGFEAVVVPGKE